MPDTADAMSQEREVLVTAAFTAVDDGSAALAFLPDSGSPSLGYVVSAPREGGLDLFDIDGQLRERQAGPRMTSIAAAPYFQIRGESLPLIFGADAENDTLYGYAVVMDRAQMLELPLATPEAGDGISAVCLLREGAGFVDLAVLGDGASAEIWRVMDAGGEALQVTREASLTLSAPARNCDADEGDLLLVSPAAGISRVSADGEVLAEAMTTASDLAVGHFNGSRLVLLTDGNSGQLTVLGARDLQPSADVTIVDGLSTPGVSRAGSLAATDASYGVTAYSQGMIAVFDNADGRIKVISREAFARALVDSE